MLKQQLLNAVALMSLFTVLTVSSEVGAHHLIDEAKTNATSGQVISHELNAGEVNNMHDLWNNLVSRHVVPVNNGHSTAVDYIGMQKQHVELQAYLSSLTAIKKSEFDHWSNSKQLAFLINAYNAWTVELILMNQPTDKSKKLKSIKDIGGMFTSPWNKSFIPLFGKTLSLNDIEHELIRGALDDDGELKYNDPRIHFAVNCASIGCPALRAQAYTSDKLDAQLEEQTIRFLSDTTRNIANKNTLKLSSIFKWYGDDFAQGFKDSYSLEEFLVHYSDALKLSPVQLKSLKSEDMKIKYLDYNWSLNAQP